MKECKKDRESWLADSGASSHLTNDSACMKNRRTVQVSVRVSNGDTVTATVRGDVELKVENGQRMILRDVLYVPSLHRNLISTNKITMKGGKMVADSTGMILSMGKLRVKIPMVTEDGKHMYVLKGTRIGVEEANNVKTDTPNEKIKRMPISMDINTAHSLCHLGEKLLRVTFSELGVKLTGQLKPCEGCCRANARAKAVRKSTNVRATKPGERLFVDTSGPYPESLSGNRYWIQIVDDFSRKGWSKFRKSKVDLPKVVEEHVRYLRTCNYPVKFLRCDNAGEHQEKLRAVCNKCGIELEYTAPHTPQMNGVCERRIAVNLSGARAFLYASNFTEKTRKALWAEAINYTEQVRNAMSTSNSKESADFKFFGKSPNFLSHMVEFGRIGYVTKREKILGKLEERSTKMIMVGYATNHSGDVYRMYNPRTRRIILTRDVKWADWTNKNPKDDMDLFSTYDSVDTVPGVNEMYVVANSDVPTDTVREISDEGESVGVPKSSSVISVPTVPTPRSVDRYEKGRQQTKVRRELRKLRTAYNPTVSPVPSKNVDLPSAPERVRESARDGQYIVTGNIAPLQIDMDAITDGPTDNDGDVGESAASHFVLECAYNTAVTSDEGEPRTFKEMLKCKNSALWKLSAIAEVNNFLYRKAWTPVKLSTVKEMGRKVIGVKWVFKIKSE